MTLTINSMQRPSKLAFKENIDPESLDKPGELVFVTRKPGVLESHYSNFFKDNSFPDRFVGRIIGKSHDNLCIEVVGDEHSANASVKRFWNEIFIFERIKASKQFLKKFNLLRK